MPNNIQIIILNQAGRMLAGAAAIVEAAIEGFDPKVSIDGVLLLLLKDDCDMVDGCNLKLMNE
jgi:hypothetical protein